jgi:hypothetical protein
MSIARIFRPDHARYQGVRPINIYLLRLLYFLMAALVATDAWRSIITLEGPWDHIRAVATCVWATYPTLPILGLIHPLRMLPIMFCAICYKAIWLAVAYPLWSAGALAGSPAEEMTKAFLWLPLAIIAVPWGYSFRRYVIWRQARRPRSIPGPATLTKERHRSADGGAAR